jgi:fucose permease
MDALGRPDLPARERLITAVDGGDRRLLTAANAALGCIGLYVGAVGPSLSTIARDGGVALDTAGFVVAAMAAGSVVASGLVAARLHRRSQRRIAALGTAGMAMGLLGLAWAGPWPLILVVALLTGAGGGLADAGTHGLAASAGRPDVAVSQLNRAFAFGAMVGPAWAGVVLQTTGDRWPVFVAPAVVAAVVAVMLARAPEREAVTASVRDSPARPANIPGAAMVMAALLFLYVGAEIGLGAWTTAATRRAADASILVGALVTSAYWGALWLGRVASGVAIQRGWHSRRVLIGSIGGAGIGSLALAGTGSVVAAGAVAAAFTGFCFGPIWPAAIAIGTRGAPPSTPAFMVTVGNGGGIVLPVIQGRVLVGSGPQAGMAISALLCAGMLVLAVVGSRGGSSHRGSADS